MRNHISIDASRFQVRVHFQATTCCRNHLFTWTITCQTQRDQMLARRNDDSERGVSNEGAVKINFGSKRFGEDVQFRRLARDWSRRNYRHSSFRIIRTWLSRYESALIEQQISTDVGGHCCALGNNEIPPIHYWVLRR